MEKSLFRKTLLFLPILILTLVLSTACSKESEDVLEDFDNTTWRSSPNKIELDITHHFLVIRQDIKPNMDPEDSGLDEFENYRDLIGSYENISIEKMGKELKIYNDEGLDLNFKVISENELEDEWGNTFKKR